MLPLATSLLLLAAVPDSVFDNKTAWQPEETDGDLKLEGRPITNSSWLEYRIVTTTETAPDALCTSVFDQATKGKGGSNVKLRKLLKDGGDERVLYDQVEAPMVSKRDYAMTVKRLPGEPTCRIRFKITNDEAPKLEDGVVRMEMMWGGWDFEKKGEKTQVTHFLYADPAGAVPAWIARGSQKKALKEAVQRMLENAKKK
ncbi:MAG: hypothetical protein JNK82_42930 [Myxococcaceae bacterium]|nr:hypothetical protein [Myxococcaceae bacterium]